MKMDESNNLGEELKGAALKKGDKFYIKKLWIIVSQVFICKECETNYLIIYF